jgi:hypothetical protein
MAQSTANYSISSQVVASSIQELAHFADLIVIGQVVSKEKVINTARNPQDLSQPDPRYYSINQVYKVEVEKVIKGGDLKSLLVVQNQGFLSLTADQSPSLSEIEGEVHRNNQKTYIPLSLNKRFFFFLRVLDKVNYDLDGYQSADLYAGVAEPWRFEITGNGSVIPETLLSGTQKNFPSNNLETVLDAIGQQYIPGQINNPYPQPPVQEQQNRLPYP